MALRINQSGTYRNTTSLCVNQSGTYRTIVDGCINQSGTYRCFGMTAATASLSVSPSSVVCGNSATLSWSSTRATCVVSTTNFSTGATSGSTSVSPASTTTYSITFGNSFANSGAASATLTVTAPTPGDSFGGGFLICQSGGIRWVVSPYSAEVARTWYGRGDAVTRAQQVSGVGGWFVPTICELSYIGHACRSFWGPSPCYSSSYYWSNCPGAFNPYCAYMIAFFNGVPYIEPNSFYTCVRAFRCVAY